MLYCIRALMCANGILQLALEEEDVWRAVVNWAKFHAGVVQRTAHWTEEERARVCQHLSGVIHHVRLLLIGKLFSLPPPTAVRNFYIVNAILLLF